MSAKEMHINTSRGHLLLPHPWQYLNFARIPKGQRQDAWRRLFNMSWLSLPTQCPLCYGGIASLGPAWTIFCLSIIRTRTNYIHRLKTKSQVQNYNFFCILHCFLKKNFKKVWYLRKKHYIRRRNNEDSRIRQSESNDNRTRRHPVDLLAGHFFI